MQESAHGHVMTLMTQRANRHRGGHRLPTVELYLCGRKSHFQSQHFFAPS